MSGDLCLTSVHVMSHFHPSHQNCIAAPSRSCLTSIQIPGFVFPLQPVVSRSREFHFISIQVPFHPHAYLKTCVLPLFRSRLTFLQIRRFVSHLHPGQSIQVVSYLHVGPENCISAPWGLISPPSKSQILHLTSIQVLSQPQAAFEICTSPLARSCLSSVPTPRFASYFHLGYNIHVSPPSKSRMTSMQIPLFVSQLHPGPISPHPSPEMCVSFSSKYWLTSSEHQFIYLTSIHFKSLPSPPRHLNLCLTSIPVISHHHPGPHIHVSPPSRSCLISIKVQISTSHLHPGRVSTPSRSVTRIVAQLHLCPILPKFRSQYMRLISINVLSHLHPGL